MLRVPPSYEERIAGARGRQAVWDDSTFVGVNVIDRNRAGTGGLRVALAARPGVRLRDRQPVDRMSAVIVGP
jgi:hypothetical protein